MAEWDWGHWEVGTEDLTEGESAQRGHLQPRELRGAPTEHIVGRSGGSLVPHLEPHLERAWQRRGPLETQKGRPERGQIRSLWSHRLQKSF